MSTTSLRLALAGLALSGMTSVACAQTSGQPAAPAQPAAAAKPAPQVVKWEGGELVINGSEVILNGKALTGPETVLTAKLPAGAASKGLNVVSNSGNGIGNRIDVKGTPGALTLVQNARNGIGNKLNVDPDGVVLDVDALIAGLKKPEKTEKPEAPKAPEEPKQPADPKMAPADPAAPAGAADPKAAAPSYKGKDKKFWTKKEFCDKLDCNLYWDPTTKMWFKYMADEDTYRPASVQPAAPEEK